MTIARSREAPAWMEAHGARWQPALRGTLQLDRTNRFFLGGGKALVNAYYEHAIAAGVEVRYRSRVDRLCFSGDRVTSVVVGDGAPGEEVACGAVVVASGGFEANIEWLRRIWGDAVDNYRIRGTPHNDGHVLARLLEAGALARGNERGFHAIAVDARAPRFDGGIVTRVDSIPFGIVVDRTGHRFYDEGEDIWPKRYAIWGRLIAQQPGQIAYSIFDSKAHDHFIPCAYPPYTAATIDDLARTLGLDAEMARTVAAFNAAAHAGGSYDMSGRDGRATRGLEVPKSNWALALDASPFYAYPVVPGITFTYLGLGVDASARVLRTSGGAFANVFAAGEVMSGNILRNGYLGGFGMTIGTVFGRIAGEEAAAHVRH
jgi:tricarballylate dehydrogenase